jgi:hypothetical protein
MAFAWPIRHLERSNGVSSITAIHRGEGLDVRACDKRQSSCKTSVQRVLSRSTWWAIAARASISPARPWVRWTSAIASSVQRYGLYLDRGFVFVSNSVFAW